VEDEVPEGGKRSEVRISPSPHSEARMTIVSFIGEGSCSPTGKKSLTKLSQVPSEAPIHADEDEGDQVEEAIQQNVEKSQGDDPEEEEIYLLSLKRNILIRDKVLAENEIQIINEVQRARVDKGKGIANLEPADKPQEKSKEDEGIFVTKQDTHQKFDKRPKLRNWASMLNPSSKSPIKNLQEVVLGGTNRFESLIENSEVTNEDLATPTSAGTDIVDITITTTWSGTLARPDSNIVPSPTDIATQIDSFVEKDPPVVKDAAEAPDPPQPTPAQPLLIQTNKKSSSGKKNKRRSI
ncbi:hypothetical protein U1Q18_010452, partial [Sarracenia purpurea var. burkii]